MFILSYSLDCQYNDNRLQGMDFTKSRLKNLFWFFTKEVYNICVILPINIDSCSDDVDLINFDDNVNFFGYMICKYLYLHWLHLNIYYNHSESPKVRLTNTILIRVMIF